jgi:hypothetical protein
MVEIHGGDFDLANDTFTRLPFDLEKRTGIRCG